MLKPSHHSTFCHLPGHTKQSAKKTMPTEDDDGADDLGKYKFSRSMFIYPA